MCDSVSFSKSSSSNRSFYLSLQTRVKPDDDQDPLKLFCDIKEELTKPLPVAIDMSPEIPYLNILDVESDGCNNAAKCLVCGRVFGHRYNLTRHMESLHNTTSMRGHCQCVTCGKT